MDKIIEIIQKEVQIREYARKQKRMESGKDDLEEDESGEENESQADEEEKEASPTNASKGKSKKRSASAIKERQASQVLNILNSGAIT